MNHTENKRHPLSPILDATAKLLAELSKIAQDPETPPHISQKIFAACEQSGMDEAIKNAQIPFNN